MSELVQLILRMSQDIRMLKSCIQIFQKMRQENHKEPWLDDQQAVQQFHISIRTLRRLRQKGKLPYTRVRGKIFYKTRDLEQLQEKRQSQLKKGIHGNQ